MLNMNVFRVLGDLSHTASKCILIWAIHSNKSSEGVSLITQALYIAVFLSRYLDLFWVPPAASWWNFILKNFYIWSSIYIIILMTKIYARTREREKAWKLGAYAVGGSLVAAPLVTLIFEGTSVIRFPVEVLWTFSIILESVCILPQLLLLRQTTVPTVIDSFYLLTLGSYRGFYILNWIVRAAKEHHFDPISVIFGVIQTAFYIDFAWVYWTRQRVKLRGGGVVDSEDLRKGWLVNKAIGIGRPSTDSDVEEGQIHTDGISNERAAPPPKTSRWGARGVSVSADDILEGHQQKQKAPATRKDLSGNQQESQAMLDDDDVLFSDGDDDAPILNSHEEAVINSNQKWGTSAK